MSMLYLLLLALTLNPKNKYHWDFRSFKQVCVYVIYAVNELMENVTYFNGCIYFHIIVTRSRLIVAL